MNKNEFGLLLEDWGNFLQEDADKTKDDFNLELFVECLDRLESEINLSKANSLLENNLKLSNVYTLNEESIFSRIKRSMTKDTGEKLTPGDDDSLTRTEASNYIKGIVVIVLLMKVSALGAFGATPKIPVDEIDAPPAVVAELKNINPDKIDSDTVNDFIKSLPEEDQKSLKVEVDKKVKEEIKKQVKKIKKVSKKIKSNKEKAKKLKSKNAKNKALKKVEQARKAATKHVKKALEDIKKTGIDYKAAEKELMDDPDVQEALDLAQNAPHGESGENVVNIEISEQTLQLKQAFKNIKSELNKFSANNEMKKIDNLSDHNDLSSVDDMLEEASNTTVSNLIQIAKIYAFKKAFSDSTFEKNILDHTIKTKLTEKTIDDKDSSDMKVSSKGNSESSFLAWLLQTANSTDSNEVLHDDYDAPGDGAYDKLTRDLDDNAKDYLDVENNPYYTDFKFAFEKACFAAAKGYKPAQKSVGVDYDAVESNVSVFIKGKTIGAIDADDSKKSK